MSKCTLGVEICVLQAPTLTSKTRRCCAILSFVAHVAHGCWFPFTGYLRLRGQSPSAPDATDYCIRYRSQETMNCPAAMKINLECGNKEDAADALVVSLSHLEQACILGSIVCIAWKTDLFCCVPWAFLFALTALMTASTTLSKADQLLVAPLHAGVMTSLRANCIHHPAPCSSVVGKTPGNHPQQPTESMILREGSDLRQEVEAYVRPFFA